MRIQITMICLLPTLYTAAVYSADWENPCAIQLAGVSKRALYFARGLDRGLKKMVGGEEDLFFPGFYRFMFDRRADGIWDNLAFYAESLNSNKIEDFKVGSRIAFSNINLKNPEDVLRGHLLLRLNMRLGVSKIFQLLNEMSFPQHPTAELKKFVALILEYIAGSAGGDERAAVKKLLLKFVAMPEYFSIENTGEFLIALTEADPNGFVQHLKLLEPQMELFYGDDTTVGREALAQRRKYLVEDLRTAIGDEKIMQGPGQFSKWWTRTLQTPN